MIKADKMARNPEKSPFTAQHTTSRGNAMIYVLIAIALFGFLTVTLARQNNQADGQDISDEQANLYANELIDYGAAAQQTIDMMQMSGSEISDLLFTKPTEGTFETAPNIHKVYHPAGGGLNYAANFSQGASPDGNGVWWIQNALNVVWTDPGAAGLADVILTANNIRREICENLNIKITGSATIPALTVDTPDIFDPDNFSAASFNATNCPGCDGFPTLCVSNAAVDTYAFYNIIAAD
jgi:hypothetical protein